MNAYLKSTVNSVREWFDVDSAHKTKLSLQWFSRKLMDFTEGRYISPSCISTSTCSLRGLEFSKMKEKTINHRKFNNGIIICWNY